MAVSKGELAPLFAILDSVATSLVKSAKKLSHVIIITNASRVWVSLSGKYLLPCLAQLIRTAGIQVMHASEYAVRAGEKDPTRFKLHAFNYMTRLVMRKCGRANFLGIGDKQGDADALEKSGLEFVGRILKLHQRLLEHPTISSLALQLKLVEALLPTYFKAMNGWSDVSPPLSASEETIQPGFWTKESFPEEFGLMARAAEDTPPEEKLAVPGG